MTRSFFMGILATAGLVATGFSASALAADTTTAAAPNMSQVSYAIGYNIGHTFKAQEIAVTPADVLAGMEAGMGKTKSTMTEQQVMSTLQAYQMQLQQKMQAKEDAMAAANLKKSDVFMEHVANKRGIHKITDGLYYQVLTEGKGPMPTATDTVTVNYEGKLINGKVFDSSYQRGKPVTFAVNQVIPGWTQTLEHMPVGSTWMVYIAPNLAYGKMAPPVIGPNQALVFKIELISIQAAAQTAQK